MINLLDETNQSIICRISIGETVMHWYQGECLLNIVVAKGALLNKKTNRFEHVLIVEVEGKKIFVTKVV